MSKSIWKSLMLLLPVSALVLGSCSSGNNDEPEPQPQPEEKAGLTFSTDISGMSRALDTGFEAGDEISVFAIDPQVSPTGQIQNINYADNVKYVYNPSLFEAASAPLYYTASTPSLYFKAIYPYIPSQKGPVVSFYVDSDQSTYARYTKSDLMLAETTVTSDVIPHLSFYHYLSNIIINVTFEGERPTGQHSVEFLSQPTNLDFDINAKTVKPYTSASSLRDIRACSNGADSYKIIAVPHTNAADANIIKLKIGDKELYWQPGKALEWRSGKQYTYDLVVTRSGDIKFTAYINPWDESPDIEEVIPPGILDDMEEWIPIYRGVNPPIINGAYFIDPMVTVYCQDEGHGGFSPGDKVNSEYIRFMNQDNRSLTLDFESVTASGTSSEVGYGSFISGEGDNFTVYFDTEGQSGGIYIRTALVISGTKVSNGISNLRYAFVMVEKGDDPDHRLMEEGIFRIFRDSDELAQSVEWPGASRSLSIPSEYLPEIYARK